MERFRGVRFLTLFAAEEIPATIVTYVALLMLLQLGLTPARATLYTAILFVPWMLKPFMRPWVDRVGAGHLRLMLHLIEALLSGSMLLLAFSFRQGSMAVFFALVLVSLFCAWHGLAARRYYESMLRPSFRQLLVVPMHICSQVAVIFTYGAIIFLVGILQVYFRQMIRYSWALGCYVAAGFFLFFSLLHLCTLSSSRKIQATDSIQTPVGHGTFSAFPVRGQNRLHWLFILFLLLLPQSLMFHARVLYLFSPHVQGGLQCTIQEIGFAQGTVGVIAFSLGIAIGRRLIRRYTLQRLFWPMALCIVLSPFVYLGMTICPPRDLLQLSLCTMSAQLLFGLGLGACRLPVGVISGTRYRDTVNMLRIPLVSAVMLVPMALSGWAVEHLGFGTYFFLNALSAPICLFAIFLLDFDLRSCMKNVR